MNDENLRPLTSANKERTKRICSAGGKASGEARRAKKTMKENAQLVLNLLMVAGKEEDVKDFKSAGNKNVTVSQRIILEMAKNAMKGDVRCAKFLAELTGEYQEEQKDVNSAVDRLTEVVNAIAAGTQTEEETQP